MEYIKIKGARENNLKNINIDIPKNKLVIITGLSGSGKSSLAFDTIYAEGQRRYLESLSSYARQFLGGNEKPDVDSIEGLSPTISIDQRTTSHNPRSTVGTVTEIYDYLRLLFARIGQPICPNGHGPIQTLTFKQIYDKFIANAKKGDKLQVLAPLYTHQKGSFSTEIDKMRKEGFSRLRIDGEIISLEEDISLEKNKFHDIDIVIDRIVFNQDSDTTSRIKLALESALKYGEGKIVGLINDQEYKYSQSHACSVCGFSISEIEPRLFSFNSPIGACNNCKGLGFTYEPDENKLFPNKNLSINEGGIEYYKNTVNTTSLDWLNFEVLLNTYQIDKDKPLKDMTKKEMEIICFGSNEPINIQIQSASGNQYKKFDYVEGVVTHIKRRHLETSSEQARQFYSKFMSEITCPHCKGKRLSPIALAIKIADKDIIDITNLSIKQALDFFCELQLDNEKKVISKLVMNEIINRLSFLDDIGLGYITLSRAAATLSGGEAQRIRLATQIGASLTGITYVLDEPSIGLHQKDNLQLIHTLKKMRDFGNTLIVVEHDEETMLESDFIIDIGPKAGEQGGEVVAFGTPKEIISHPQSITGQYLSKKKMILTPDKRRAGSGKKIIIVGAKENNLKNLTIEFPLGKFIAITGVSGSGKSTLVNEVLVKNIIKRTTNPFTNAPKIEKISGVEYIDKCIVVSQDPIGRTPRSNPATYVGVFDDIRDLYAATPEAISRGYTKGRFSFNIPGGRCEKCWGDGVNKIEMHFLPDVYVVCSECNGKRYNEETLEIKYKGKSIYDVLEMTVDTALEFFQNVPSIKYQLLLMKEVGLGYLKLGTPATELSGGEAQRIKLAKFLQRKANDKTLLVLDEPTTGLHTHDIKAIIKVLNKIVDCGTTVIVIEHNLDLIKCADHIIDLGPEGGDRGGKIIALGTPEMIVKDKAKSFTGKYLDKIMKITKQEK